MSRRKNKDKEDLAYSRAGEGDDERAADQWNEKWVSEFWKEFVKEVDKNKWSHNNGKKNN
jgi:hypothetical protein